MAKTSRTVVKCISYVISEEEYQYLKGKDYEDGLSMKKVFREHELRREDASVVYYTGNRME